MTCHCISILCFTAHYRAVAIKFCAFPRRCYSDSTAAMFCIIGKMQFSAMPFPHILYSCASVCGTSAHQSSGNPCNRAHSVGVNRRTMFSSSSQLSAHPCSPTPLVRSPLPPPTMSCVTFLMFPIPAFFPLESHSAPQNLKRVARRIKINGVLHPPVPYRAATVFAMSHGPVTLESVG